MNSNPTTSELVNKYPTKRSLYDFLSLTYFQPKFNSSCITIEFLINMADKTVNMLRITNEQISDVPKYKKQYDKRSIFPVEVILYKLHHYLKSSCQYDLAGYKGVTNYSWCDRVCRFFDKEDKQIKIYPTTEMSKLLNTKELDPM